MMDKQYAYHTFSVNLLNSENNYVAKIFSEVKINKKLLRSHGDRVFVVYI